MTPPVANTFATLAAEAVEEEYLDAHPPEDRPAATLRAFSVLVENGYPDVGAVLLRDHGADEPTVHQLLEEVAETVDQDPAMVFEMVYGGLLD